MEQSFEVVLNFQADVYTNDQWAKKQLTDM